MRCGWGPYFRRTFEVQAGNSPLQGQSKPPAKLVVLIVFLNHEGLKAIEKYDNIKDKTDITVDIGMKGRII